MTWILGISAFYHDSAAALIKDGEVIAAAQEERFTRRKGDARYPQNAVQYCLTEAGLTCSQLDFAVFYEKPLLKFERLLETYLSFAPKGFESFRQALPQWVGMKLDLSGEIRRNLPGFQGELLFAQHHDSHAASAFFPSPFEEAAVLTLDAAGEWGTSAFGIGRGNQLTLTHELQFPHSLGMLYSAFTYYMGFKVNSGEYKVMGLAPYGKPIYVDGILGNIVEIAADGSVWLDMSYFDYCHGLTMTSERFHAFFGGRPRQPEELITQKEMDLAASIQQICEKAVLRTARHVHRETGMKNLVMAGGVALNCVANGRVQREGPFEDLWIQPAAGDAGGALGAALLAWYGLLGKPRRAKRNDSQSASALGPAFSNEDIQVFLDSVGAEYTHYADEDQLLGTIADLLSAEKVVGWFYGRMEYGPRALGRRSILGDARSTRMQQTMNLKIKFRESFRPFAPCVLQELAHTVFEMGEQKDSPYMLLVAPVREQWRTRLSDEDHKRMQDPDLRVRVSVARSTIPAITHVDYSARVQTVDAERHGRFYRLMQRFYEKTGCPVIVNTSFNIRGEPIVCSFEDAFRCFMATDMDCLVLEQFLITKDQVSNCFSQTTDDYKARYVLD